MLKRKIIESYPYNNIYKYKEYIINYLKLKLSKFAMFPNF